jgi:hypothetical protein
MFIKRDFMLGSVSETVPFMSETPILGSHVQTLGRFHSTSFKIIHYFQISGFVITSVFQEPANIVWKHFLHYMDSSTKKRDMDYDFNRTGWCTGNSLDSYSTCPQFGPSPRHGLHTFTRLLSLPVSENCSSAYRWGSSWGCAVTAET